MPDSPEKRCCLLIAMPQLADPNFFRTTSLLSEFTKEGAMGVILNRPLGISVTQLVHDGKPIEGPSTIQAYWGGPVQNERGFVVHESLSLASQGLEIESGLFLSGSSEVLRALMEEQKNPNPPRFRLFLGYAGWGAGQLEQEIAAASWLTAPIDRELIFDSAAQTLWTRSIQKLGVDVSALASVPQGEAN
ncbi:MAG: YqgE/AlgH family protein [Pseudomonadota bacterium]